MVDDIEARMKRVVKTLDYVRKECRSRQPSVYNGSLSTFAMCSGCTGATTPIWEEPSQFELSM